MATEGRDARLHGGCHRRARRGGGRGQQLGREYRRTPAADRAGARARRHLVHGPRPVRRHRHHRRRRMCASASKTWPRTPISAASSFKAAAGLSRGGLDRAARYGRIRRPGPDRASRGRPERHGGWPRHPSHSMISPASSRRAPASDLTTPIRPSCLPRARPGRPRSSAKKPSRPSIAAVRGEPAELVREAADVLYHLLVVLHGGGVALEEVMAELQRRTDQSGLDEKAARTAKPGA